MYQGLPPSKGLTQMCLQNCLCFQMEIDQSLEMKIAKQYIIHKVAVELILGIF